MKKYILLAILIVSSFYGFNQNIDKSSKKYEEFIAKKKLNPDIKLLVMTVKISSEFLDKPEILQERLDKLNSIKSIYQIEFGEERNVIKILYEYDNSRPLNENVLNGVFGNHFKILNVVNYEN